MSAVGFMCVEGTVRPMWVAGDCEMGNEGPRWSFSLYGETERGGIIDREKAKAQLHPQSGNAKAKENTSGALEHCPLPVAPGTGNSNHTKCQARQREPGEYRNPSKTSMSRVSFTPALQSPTPPAHHLQPYPLFSMWGSSWLRSRAGDFTFTLRI